MVKKKLRLETLIPTRQSQSFLGFHIFYSIKTVVTYIIKIF